MKSTYFNLLLINGYHKVEITDDGVTPNGIGIMYRVDRTEDDTVVQIMATDNKVVINDVPYFALPVGGVICKGAIWPPRNL